MGRTPRHQGSAQPVNSAAGQGRDGGVSRPVGRVLCLALPRGGGHPSRTAVAGSLVRSTREHRAGSPQTLAQALAEAGALLTLLQVGFTKQSQSPATLVVSYTTVSPLPSGQGRRAVCFLWHCPAGHPGSTLSTTLPCGARTFLTGPRGPARPPGRLTHTENTAGKGAPFPHVVSPRRPSRGARDASSHQPFGTIHRGIGADRNGAGSLGHRKIVDSCTRYGVKTYPLSLPRTASRPVGPICHGGRRRPGTGRGRGRTPGGIGADQPVVARADSRRRLGRHAAR
jgi:hypothetical protein